MRLCRRIGIHIGDLYEKRLRRLFDGRFARASALWTNYDVTPDGQRFIMAKSAEEFTSPMQMTVVLNWVEELRQRVPVH